MTKITLDLLDSLVDISGLEAREEYGRISNALEPVKIYLEKLETIAKAEQVLDATQHLEETARDIEPPVELAPWHSTTMYRRNARVTHNGKRYRSLVAYNLAWDPETTLAHAWVMDEPPPVPNTGPQPWATRVQYYADGNLESKPTSVVTHGGQTWEAKLTHVSHAGWAPSAYTHAVWKKRN